MNEFIFATLGLQAFPCGKSGAHSLIIWAFPHIYVRSGYILWVARFTPFPPNLIKRSLAPENIKKELPTSLRPKGSLSLTQRHPHRIQTLPLIIFYTPNSKTTSFRKLRKAHSSHASIGVNAKSPSHIF